MAENFAARAFHFSIVVVGPMNPRLHHPTWYRLIDAISAEEEAIALASPGTFAIPQLAHFEVGGLTISCHLNRWEIVATQPAARERMKSTAALVFKKLFETPIQLYGLNSNFQLETKVSDVAKCLTAAVVSLEIGLTAEGEASPTITLVDRHDSRQIRVVLEPSPLSKEVLSVACNTQYEIADEVNQRPDAKPAYFDLGDLLSTHFEQDYSAAVSRATAIVEKMNRKCGDL